MTQINIEELKAELRKGNNKIVRHKDGGFYTTLFLSKVKQPDGSWVESVNYTRYPNKDGDLFTRSLENFAERLTQVDGENILMFDVPAIKDFTSPNKPVDIANIVIARSVNLGLGLSSETGPKYQFEVIETPSWENPVLKIFTQDPELLENIGLNEGRIIQRPHFIDGVLTNKSTKYLYTDISELTFHV